MNDEQLLRYSRHILLPQIDVNGQQALLDARVLILGLGGLGSSAALYLASSGLGHLRLVDSDSVELSNLQRQIAHGENDIGQSKVASARGSIMAMNSDVKVECIEQPASNDNIASLIEGVDVIVDCSDNYAARRLVNRASFASNIPLVFAAAIRGEAQLSVFNRNSDSPCYACVYGSGVKQSGVGASTEEQQQERCADSGVVAPLVGIVGAMQALEVLKLVADFGSVLDGQLLSFDAMHMDWHKLRLKKNTDCSVCRTATTKK